MAVRLGRWCISVGKWEKSCRPHSKGLLADADNSFWPKPPIDTDGNIVTSEKKAHRDEFKPEVEDQPSWVERLLANYHG
jgi:hypothetical protein